METVLEFENILYGISGRLRPYLENLPLSIKSSAEEIRIRVGLPLALTIKGKSVFILNSGQTSTMISSDLVKATKQDLEESFKLLLSNSLFAHENELKNGYIMIKNGHRVGVCGRIGESGIPHDISSLNIRISHQILGSADKLIEKYKSGGVLIAGPPGSGKTTVLRDFIRQISNGKNTLSKRIVVVDSRGELSGSYNGLCFNDLGQNTDVLITHDKALGIEISVRTMFPQMVAFDEIGTAKELSLVSQSFCSGVDIITTAHIGKLEELKVRSITKNLLLSGAVNMVVFLKDNHSEPIIVPLNEL